MKKGIKVILILSSILFSIGLIMVIVGFISGGKLKNISFLSGKEFNYMSIDESYSNVSIENLDLEISAGNVYIEEGESFHVKGTHILEDTIEVGVKNNTLYIKEKDSFPWNFVNHIGIYFNGTESKITITIPRDTVIKNAEVEVRAGKFEIEKLNSEVFDLEVDAGKAILNKLSVNKEAYISVEAGSVSAEDYNGNNLELDVSAGTCDMRGAFYNTLDLSCSAGEIDIDTSLGDDEYSYDLEQNAGSIRINGESYKEYNNKNSSLNNKIKAKSDAGFIKITTK